MTARGGKQAGKRTAKHTAKQLETRRARRIAGALATATALLAWPAAASPLPVTKEAQAVAQVKKTKKRTPTTISVRPGHWTAPTGPGTADAREPKERHPKKNRSPVQIALAVARKQLGKPYRWAGTGPNGFDCSGFTMFVYGKAGVSLPHNSGRQYNSVKQVPVDKLKPGDLVFSGGSYIHHVGIYIGDGKMIHSPHSGRRVEIAPVRANRGAGRPVN